MVLFFISILNQQLAYFGWDTDTVEVTSSTDIFLFIIVCILIIILSYSFITMHNQNRLIEKQNKEIMLKNEQLQEQNEKLKKINDEKTNLIGIVSHDLKSPFNRIFALLNLLKLTNDEPSKEQSEYLSKMHQVIKDGMALIRNLLDMRAIEDEGIKMTIGEVDVLKIAKEIIIAHRPLADIKNIKIKLTRESNQAKIVSDQLYIVRIVENLLSNALKFSEKGKIVEISVKMNENDVQLSVADQGPGISAEDMKNLFQKFHVLSTKPTDGESSTGLGLSIVKSLTSKLEGSITCESKPDEGAKFILKLPVNMKGV